MEDSPSTSTGPAPTHQMSETRPQPGMTGHTDGHHPSMDGHHPSMTEKAREQSRDMAADKNAWAEAMAKLRPDVDRATLDTLGQAFATSWSVNGGLQRDELTFTQDWLYQSPEFKDTRKVDLSEWTDFSVEDAVLDDIGAVDTGDKVSR